MPVFHGSLQATPILLMHIPQPINHVHVFIGSSICCLSIICAVWHTVVLLAELKCCKKHTSFILISSQSVCDICSLLLYFMLGIDICLGRKNPLLPLRWSSFIYTTFQILALPHYLFIAVNRTTAIFMPTRMNRIWTKRTTIVLISLIWCVSVGGNLAIHFSAPADDANFWVAKPEEYRFGPLSSVGIPIHELGAYFSLVPITTISLSIILYAITVIYAAYMNSKSNFLPYAVKFYLEATLINADKIDYLLFTVIGIINRTSNSILLPLFSKAVQDDLKALRRRHKVHPKSIILSPRSRQFMFASAH